MPFFAFTALLDHTRFSHASLPPRERGTTWSRLPSSGFSTLDETTAELKRMYVVPSLRGRGIGRRIVEALEREARLLGSTKLVLETGTRLKPAVKLYEATGYVRIPLFGEYLSSPDTSVCFGKSLV